METKLAIASVVAEARAGVSRFRDIFVEVVQRGEFGLMNGFSRTGEQNRQKSLLRILSAPMLFLRRL